MGSCVKIPLLAFKEYLPKRGSLASGIKLNGTLAIHSLIHLLGNYHQFKPIDENNDF